MMQKRLIPLPSVLDKLDERVRSIVIDGEQYISVLDLLKYHGNKKNPSQAWKTTLKFMEEKQGFSFSPSHGDYAFEGSDGKKKRATPIINLQEFYRFAQSADVPEWEEIRQWQSKISSDVSKAVIRRQREIEKYERAGYGDAPEIQHLRARDENIKVYKNLKSTMQSLIDKPVWHELTNAEYLALFGATAKQLKALLANESIRDSLPAYQLQALTYSEATLTALLQSNGEMDNERAKRIIELGIKPIGEHLKFVSDALGVHHITGKPLLGSGE